jgi:hypothetical protein
MSSLVNITHNGMLSVEISFVFMQCNVHVYSADYFFDNVFISTTSEHQNQLRVKRKHAFLNHVLFFIGTTALVGQGLLVVEVKRLHSDTPHWAGLLWTSYKPDAETSTCQHTTLKVDRAPCTRRDSNSQSQQANCHRSTP